MPRKALGRGLKALIPDLPDEESGRTVIEVDIDSVSPNPYQPREFFDSEKLDELTQSILEKGVIQPITVRTRDGGYELITGERRLRATKRAGMETIPAIVVDVSTPEEMLELSLVENIQRDDLNPIHEAKAYQRLMVECHMTHEMVAKKVGKDRSSISNTLRLLKLPEDVQQQVISGGLSMGHARALLGLPQAQDQLFLCREIIKKGLSVRKVEELVRGHITLTPARAPRRTRRNNAQLVAIEEELQRVLGTRVRIHQGVQKGKIEIEFYSNEDLERLLEMLHVHL